MYYFIGKYLNGCDIVPCKMGVEINTLHECPVILHNMDTNEDEVFNLSDAPLENTIGLCRYVMTDTNKRYLATSVSKKCLALYDIVTDITKFGLSKDTLTIRESIYGNFNISLLDNVDNNYFFWQVAVNGRHMILMSLFEVMYFALCLGLVRDETVCSYGAFTMLGYRFYYKRGDALLTHMMKSTVLGNGGSEYDVEEENLKTASRIRGKSWMPF